MAYTLNFSGYDVLKVDFERVVPEVAKAPGAQVELNPEFAQKILDHKGGRYSVELGARVNQNDFPIRIEVVLRGHFELKDAEDPIRVMQVNATAILLPYLRATFGMLTTLAGIKPIVLPIVNIAALFPKQPSSGEANPVQ